MIWEKHRSRTLIPFLLSFVLAGFTQVISAAPAAQAADPTVISVTKVRAGLASVKWTDVRSSEPNLTGYSLRYTKQGGGSNPVYTSTFGSAVTSGSVCIADSGFYNYSIAKIISGTVGTYSATVGKNIGSDSVCSGTGSFGYTVNFFSNGGSGTMNSVSNTSNAYVVPATTFSPPTNKSFSHWNTLANNTGTTYDVGDVIPITSAQTVNLHAQYNDDYSISNVSASPISSSVATGYTAISTQSTITLTRAGQSGSNPVATITVDAGTWSVSAVSGVTLSAASVSSAGPITATLTSSTGSFTIALATGSNAGTYTSSLTSATTNPLDYSVTVSNGLPAPSISLSAASVTGTYGTPLSEPVYTVYNFGGNVSSYSISPALPTGLTFDAQTALISGTPTQIKSATTQTITGTNATGSATTTFTLTINKATPVITNTVQSLLLTDTDTAVNNPTASVAGTWSSPISGDESVLTIMEGKIHPVAVGTAVVTSTFTPTDSTNYNSSSGTTTVTIGNPEGSVSTTFTRAGATITNSAFEGVSVSADISNIPSGGTYTYQWFGGSDSANLTSISTISSANSSYTPKASDRSLANQMYLAVQVVATISGNPYTFTSTAVPVYTFPNATGGSVTSPSGPRGTYTSGKYKVGQSVVGHAWAVMGTPWPTLDYQWWVCNTSTATANPQAAAALATPTCAMATGAGNSGTATRNGGATAYDLGGYGFSYPVTSQAAGKFLTFTATLSNAATTAQGAVFTLTQSRTMNSGIIQTTPVITGAPNISGTPQVGKRLTAATVSVEHNNLNPSGKISYQWQRCTSSGSGCANISGATRTTYTPVSADQSKYLQVIATATNSAGDTAIATSATPWHINYLLPSGLLVSLDTTNAAVGATLTAVITAVTGFPEPTYLYQWQRCRTTGASCTSYSNISGATSSTYTTVTQDRNKYIRVSVRATNAAGTSASVISSNRAGPITGG